MTGILTDAVRSRIDPSDAFTALLLMALAGTMLTIPVVSPKLQRMKERVFGSKRR